MRNIKAALHVLKYHLLKKRTPLIVAWSLTNRCNLRCKYCNAGNIETKELTTKQVFRILDELKKMGTIRIGFTGGEPLLRKDIGQILRYAKKKGFIVGLSTNALLFKKKNSLLKYIDSLQLSIDGKKRTTDSLRGKGAYDATVEAINLAKKDKIHTYGVFVLSNKNVNEIEFVCNLAKKMGFFIFFQPVEDYYFASKEARSLLLKADHYKEALKQIIRNKKSNKYILNSTPALDYLYSWPQNKKMNCFAGKLFCRIESDGRVYSCDRTLYEKPPQTCKDTNFKTIFDNLEIAECNGCLCNAAIEFNYLFSSNLKTILNTLRILT